MTDDHSLLWHLGFSLKKELKGKGIDDEVSIEIVFRVDEYIRILFGGTDHYIPVKSNDSRNLLIIEAHLCGQSPIQIAKKFQLHRTTIDRIILRILG